MFTLNSILLTTHFFYFSSPPLSFIMGLRYDFFISFFSHSIAYPSYTQTSSCSPSILTYVFFSWLWSYMQGDIDFSFLWSYYQSVTFWVIFPCSYLATWCSWTPPSTFSNRWVLLFSSPQRRYLLQLVPPLTYLNYHIPNLSYAMLFLLFTVQHIN